MPADPLYLSGPYRPAIHSGSLNDRAVTRSRQHAPVTSYALWGITTGKATLTGLSSRATSTFAPGVFLLPPSSDIRIHLDAGTAWLGLTFDVVHVPRRRGGKEGRGPTWVHRNRRRQPDPVAVWGRALPTLVPAPLIASGLEMLRACNAIWWRGDPAWNRANALLDLWLAEYLEHELGAGGPAPIAGDGDPLVDACRRVIAERMHLGVTVAELAGAVGLGRTTFIDRFTATAGVPPGRFIRDERLRHAQHLLLTTDSRIEGIAHHCGYHHGPALTRAFTAAFGEGPTTWRKRVGRRGR